MRHDLRHLRHHISYPLERLATVRPRHNTHDSRPPACGSSTYRLRPGPRASGTWGCSRPLNPCPSPFTATCHPDRGSEASEWRDLLLRFFPAPQLSILFPFHHSSGQVDGSPSALGEPFPKVVFGRHEVGHLFPPCGFWGENPGFFHEPQQRLNNHSILMG